MAGMITASGTSAHLVVVHPAFHLYGRQEFPLNFVRAVSRGMLCLDFPLPANHNLLRRFQR